MACAGTHTIAGSDVGTGVEWCVRLYSSFQDDSYLYLVQEYMIGGDLNFLLVKQDELTGQPPTHTHARAAASCAGHAGA